jgi:hypothetical protein
MVLQHPYPSPKVPSQPHQVRQPVTSSTRQFVLKNLWMTLLTTTQRVLPSGFCSLARRGSHAIFLLSELCYALNVCRRRAQKLSVLACLFPLLAVTSRYNFLRTLDWYHHS